MLNKTHYFACQSKILTLDRIRGLPQFSSDFDFNDAWWIYLLLYWKGGSVQAGGNTPKCYQCLSLGCGAFASFSRSLFILKLPTMNVYHFSHQKSRAPSSTGWWSMLKCKALFENNWITLRTICEKKKSLANWKLVLKFSLFEVNVSTLRLGEASSLSSKFSLTYQYLDISPKAGAIKSLKLLGCSLWYRVW